MTSPRLNALTLAVSVVLLGCDGSSRPSDCSGDTCDVDGDVSAHRAAVLACDKQKDADLEENSSTLGMKSALEDWAFCLIDANDAALASIEPALPEETKPA